MVADQKIVMILCPKDVTLLLRKELIEKLLDLKFRVVLISPYGKAIDDFIDMGCAFYNISIDRRGTNILRDIKLIVKYWKIISRVKPDIVLTYTTKCSVYGGFVCSNLRIPYIVNNAGLIKNNKKCFLDYILLKLYKIGFNKAFCIMYQNEEERNIINSILEQKVHFRMIPGSGVNLERFSYSAYPNDNNRIIFNYVARIVEFKGINEFVKCAEIIKAMYPNSEFFIYGEYDDNNYKKVLSKYQKKGIIKYAGFKTDMIPYIEKAHAIIHASHYEGMANVILEHSAMGRVCIGSNIPGIKECIDDGITGYLFKVGDVDDLVSKVEKFIKLSIAQKKKMGIEARNRMVNYFDRNIVTNIYLEEISQCLCMH